MKKYFGYGANLNIKTMGDRCRNSILYDVGILRGYRLLINTRGVATIVPDKDSVVYGIIWEISAHDEELLDYYEGIKQSLYNKCEVGVFTLEPDTLHSCLVYIATDDKPGIPRKKYFLDMQIWCFLWNFPHAYQVYMNNLRLINIRNG